MRPQVTQESWPAIEGILEPVQSLCASRRQPLMGRIHPWLEVKIKGVGNLCSLQ